MKRIAELKRIAVTVVSCLLVALLGVSPAMAAAPSGGSFGTRAVDVKEARQALKSCEKSMPRDGEARVAALVDSARLCFIIGELGEKRRSRKFFKRGRNYARLLIAESPRRVEGHYWLALNQAGLAEVGGIAHGYRLVPVIVEELKAAMDIDPSYDQAGPHRVLGRMYYEAPGWPLSIGDMDKSLRHLRSAVEIAPENSSNHLYLAETLLKMRLPEEAQRELERVLAATSHSLWPRGLEEDRRDALKLMKEHGWKPKDKT